MVDIIIIFILIFRRDKDYYLNKNFYNLKF